VEYLQEIRQIGERNLQEGMVNHMRWYEKNRELYLKEKRILQSYGYEIYIKDGSMECEGVSSVNSKYPIKIIYSDGFPSFPPTVKCEVSEDLILVRHQNKLTKSLCLFGFTSERWKASYSAIELIEEIEELILRYSPETYDAEENVEDIVPEPLINQYDYKIGGILIPKPFGDLVLDNFNDRNNCTVRYDKHRGIIDNVYVDEKKVSREKNYDEWFNKKPTFNAQIFKVTEHPPFTTEKIFDWLTNMRIQIKNKKKYFLFFVFEDDWGFVGNKRISWVALKIIDDNAEWVRCYIINDDDSLIRTPYGKDLAHKEVTLVGLGSLGSLVATSIAQEGVRKINLIDYDIFEPANSIRHQGEQHMFSYPKVDVVKERILSLMPTTHVNVEYIGIGGHRSTEQLTKLNQILNRSDLIIETTGSHKVSHYLNRYCLSENIPLIIGSVTNGAWSCEVVRIIPGDTGCWGCWNINYGTEIPPSAPVSEIQFAPGCDQPTFIGGISSVNIASGLIVQASIDTLLNIDTKDTQYIRWSERDSKGNRHYNIDYLGNPKSRDCEACNGY